MKTTYFNLDWKATLLRFFLMMAVVILGAFTGIWVLAFLALPIFLSIMLGLTFTFGDEDKKGKVVQLKNRKVESKKVI